MKYITEFLDKCKDKVETLPHPDDTLQFFRRLNYADVEADGDVDDAFECFKMSIKSIKHTPTDNGIQVKMTRYFTGKEIFSGKQKNVNIMTSFLWSLGYKTIGAGTWNTKWEKEKAKCVELLFIIAGIFDKTAPPVRSLQSISYVFAKKLNIDIGFDNPTLNEMEGVDKTKTVSFTVCDKDLEKRIEEQKNYSIKERYLMDSYHFTTCLALLEDKVEVEHTVHLDATQDNVQRSLILDTSAFGSIDASAKNILYSCVDAMGESPLVQFFLRMFGNPADPSGISLNIPLYTEHVVSLMTDINLTLLKLKGRTVGTCHILPFFGCKHCIVKEAHYDACIIFVMQAFTKFLFTA